jgi:hypothetical protein
MTRAAGGNLLAPLDEWPAPLRGLGAARRRNLGPGEDFE